jgi:hypothetical protein
MRIRQIIGSTLWLPLIVCLSSLAASVDNIPDLPAFRQAVIGSRVTQSISLHPRTHGPSFATVDDWDEVRFSQPESAMVRPLTPPVTNRNFTRRESDSSPPVSTEL